MRVHELAKELGVTSKELLGALEQMGATGRSASSSVPEDLVPRLRASGGKATAAAPKRREVLEPPPAPRKPKPKPAPKPAKETPPSVEGVEPAAAATEGPSAPSLELVPDRVAGAEAEPVAAAPRTEPAKPGLPVMRFVRGSTPQTIADKLGRAPVEIVKI